MISVRKLSKRFGDRLVLEAVSAEVTRGETIAIVGPSGGGKTTLLRCVNFLEVYDGGSIKIDGREVGYVDNARGRRRGEVDLAATYQRRHLLLRRCGPARLAELLADLSAGVPLGATAAG